MNLIYYLIGLPILGGIICLLIPKATEVVAVSVSIVTFIVSILAFIIPPPSSEYFVFNVLGGFVVLFVTLFGFLIVLYSLKFMQDLSSEQKISLSQYYCYILLTLGAAIGAVLSNNLILLLVFWGFLGLTLYLLIQINPEPVNNSSEHKNTRTIEHSSSASAAKKTFIIIGGSDCFMILGIAIILLLTGTLQMDKIHIILSSRLAIVTFLCLIIAAFAKAGVMPLHTWVPDMAVSAPIPVTAYLPASLDKLLGIYLLIRICTGFFSFNSQFSTLNFVLMLIGAITIIMAVFMAMIQHDIKKLLSYHAVSQVGYMVLGIGTGNPIGIAGGLFHMLNHAIYKSCLFLCGGSIEYKTKTSDLANLGGLAKYMPITFITCLIAALSISGIPLTNGFVSKWMIYQGIIQVGTTGSTLLTKLWWIFIVAAMFGSALTLASFIKLLHGVFLGQPSEHENIITQEHKNTRTSERLSEVPLSMWLPQVVLAGLCIIFGVFAFQLPLKYFIFPSLSTTNYELLTGFPGFWQPRLATLLIFVGLLIGLVVYLISKVKYRKSDIYIGGEILSDDARVKGVDFYQTIKDIGFFKTMYDLAEEKIFDIYDWFRKIFISIGAILSYMHTGNLHTYLSWSLIGVIILLLVLIR
ncbi:MAG: proton-conducting transporter membrane subunit [Elusimicrobia bacterium]|nr:proton-conducting transporter membrane subunit [Elusimicrobiota bacterium]